jgi:hypothetical protein
MAGDSKPDDRSGIIAAPIGRKADQAGEVGVTGDLALEVEISRTSAMFLRQRCAAKRQKHSCTGRAPVDAPYCS